MGKMPEAQNFLIPPRINAIFTKDNNLSKTKVGGLLLSLVKIALIANRVFFKTLPRSVKTSFMTKGHGQGVLERKKLLTPSICALLPQLQFLQTFTSWSAQNKDIFLKGLLNL